MNFQGKNEEYGHTGYKRSNKKYYGNRKRYNNKNKGGRFNKKTYNKKSFFSKLLDFFKFGSSNKKKSKNFKKFTSNNSRSSRYGGNNNGEGISKKELLECSHPKLFVANLSYDVEDEDLEDLFKGFGIVESIEIVYDKRTHRSKGFAFVMMQSVEEAQRAVDNLNNKDFMGRKLVVNGAKSA